MRKLKATIFLLTLFFSIFIVTSCEDQTIHEHDYSEEWTKTAAGHYHAATCEHSEEIKDLAIHSYGAWIVTKEASETEKGSKKRVCSVCQYEEVEELPKLNQPVVHEHSYSEVWTKTAVGHYHAATCEHSEEIKDLAIHSYGAWIVTKEASEAETGSKKRVCSVCQYEEVEELPKLGQATTHNHSYSVVWTKTEVGHYHAATCEHTNEVKDLAAHNYGEWNITKEPSTTEEGTRKRVCSVCQYEDIEYLPKLEEIEVHTHSYSTVWTKTEVGHYHAATCEHTEEIKDLAAHSYGAWIITKESTEIETGSKERECNVCHYKESVTIPVKGHIHNYSNEWTIDQESTCITVGSKSRHCLGCEEKTEITYLPLNSHSFNNWKILVKATVVSEGSKERECRICHYRETESIPMKTETEELYYSLNNDGVSYCVRGTLNKQDTIIVIPSIHEGLPVTDIELMAFHDCVNLIKIVLPSSLRKIGALAFDGCHNLTSITIPDSVTNIGGDAFRGCNNITKATIPALAIPSIPTSKLVEVVITSGTQIERRAFYDCKNLTKIEIASSVTSIGNEAFYGCSNLEYNEYK
ncbi:MAG: leucine-rich repeat domain-containing protein, partial [Anaeroplasmataceae bacterium]|nr:leucine-rich repeat domain-containing protein [Anaeroplasmataceae bacterium]